MRSKRESLPSIGLSASMASVVGGHPVPGELSLTHARVKQAIGQGRAPVCFGPPPRADILPKTPRADLELQANVQSKTAELAIQLQFLSGLRGVVSERSTAFCTTTPQ